MSATTHTPGPWKFHEYESPRGYFFVKSETTNEKIVGGPSLDSEANARLIAAAPQMFEALRILASVAEKLPGCHGLALDNARAAIAAAKGNVVIATGASES